MGVRKLHLKESSSKWLRLWGRINSARFRVFSTSQQHPPREPQEPSSTQRDKSAGAAGSPLQGVHSRPEEDAGREPSRAHRRVWLQCVGQ